MRAGNPIICGQASGLRSSACSTTPQAAMPPPMATPKRTREPGAKQYFGIRVGGEDISQSLRQIEAHRSEQSATDDG